MTETEKQIPRRLLVPMCTRCGEPQGAADCGNGTHRCRRCNEDLYTRRPRSYAEMEGLIDRSLPVVTGPPRQRRLLRSARDRIRRIGVKLGIR
ncbi:MAG: hypothetical protein AAGJ54_01630 [Planctomycetota bacterium]